jgi:DNA-binding transcriptional ArsR family regulator
MEAWGQDRFLQMLKALADESRLKVFRLAHDGEYTVSDLAAKVGLTEPTVSHHLAKLRETGLVTLRMAGNQHYYRVNEVGLAKFKAHAATVEVLPPEPVAQVSDESWIEALGWAETDAQVLHDHTISGRLTSLPSKQKKLVVILRWLATLFQPNMLYTEPQVNAILKAVHAPDVAGLRRDLVDFGYLRRERGGGKYWLAPADEEPTPTRTVP